MKNQNRRGWMLLESTIVVAILLIGSIAAVRLASSQHAYRAASRQSLAADIACENAVSWLRSGSVETLAVDIEKVKTMPLADGLRFDVTPFQSGDFSGMHVSVSPAASTATSIERNLWILKVGGDPDALRIDQTSSPQVVGEQDSTAASVAGKGVDDAS